MGILDTLEKIQSKPEQTRRQIMYVLLAVCMAVIFIIWMINFRQTLNAGNEASVVATPTTSPLDYLKTVWTDLTEKINGGQK